MKSVSGWLQLPAEPKTFTIVGRLYTLTQHYLPALKSSAACIAPGNCLLCTSGFTTQTIAALPVEDPEGTKISLLRILPSQAALLNSLSMKGSTIIGSIITIEKAPGAHPSRALIAFLGKTAVHEAPIQNYINAIGRRAYERMAQLLEDQPELPEG